MSILPMLLLLLLSATMNDMSVGSWL